jgi:integrase
MEKVDLETYDSIATWKADLARTSRKGVLSKATWRLYKGYMRHFLRSLSWEFTPDELIDEARGDMNRAVNRVIGFKTHLLEQGKSMNHVVTMANGGIQSFYSHNGIRLPRITYRRETSKVVGSDQDYSLYRYDKDTKKIRFENGVLQQVVANLSFRDQVIVMCLLSTGQDTGDLFDLNVGFVRGKKGDRLWWAGDRKKTGEHFRTFFSTEATRFLKKYVETERKDADDTDPIFALDERIYDRSNPATKENETVTYGDRINPHAFAMNLREAQNKLGMIEKGKQAPFRAKRFRKLFRTACARAGIDEGYRMCFMGHAGSVSDGYLETEPAILEAEYARVEPFLEVMKSTTSEDLDQINLDLRKTKEDLSRTMESLDGQKTRLINLYERIEGERQRNAALEANVRELEEVIGKVQSDEYLDALADRMVERRLGGKIREFEETVKEITEYYNGDEFRGKVYDEILKLIEPIIAEEIQKGVVDILKNYGIEVEDEEGDDGRARRDGPEGG